MSFIKSYGTSFPLFRIEDSMMNPEVKKNSTRAVCFSDQDIITLSFDAACNCIHDLSCQTPDAVFFATSTPIFHNRYHASFLANLLNFPQGTLALDFTNSARSGTDALLIANNLIDSGKYKNILVLSADCDFPETGAELKSSTGHAACAILLSNEKGIAEIASSASFSSGLAEEFSYHGKKIQYDPRFSRDQAFKNNITSSLKSFVNDPAKYEAVILNSLYARMAGGIFLKAGFTEKQFSKDSLQSKTGYTGVVHASILLVNELEKSTLKTAFLLIDYTNGSNFFEIVKQSDVIQKSLQFNLQKQEQINSYQDYLKLKKSHSSENEVRDMFSSEIMNHREKENLIYLNGYECTSCNTKFVIKTNRCKKCKGENFIRKKLSSLGKIFSFTQEHYFPASFAPVTMAVVDLNGGGRITVQQTDTMYPEKNKMQIGSPVKLVLRKMIENDAKPNYFWKCIPD